MKKKLLTALTIGLFTFFFLKSANASLIERLVQVDVFSGIRSQTQGYQYQTINYLDIPIVNDFSFGLDDLLVLTIEFLPGQGMQLSDIENKSEEHVHVMFSGYPMYAQTSQNRLYVGGGNVSMKTTFLNPSGDLIQNPFYDEVNSYPIGGVLSDNLTNSIFGFSGFVAEIDILTFLDPPDPGATVKYMTLSFYSEDKPILTPIPTTMLLLGSGLVGLAGSRIRRKKKE